MLLGCTDCGRELVGRRRKTRRFCSDACKNAFNNRRIARGAEMYDLVMAMRFDRAAAKDEEAWTTLCRLASAYRQADTVLREGRRSWHPIGYGEAGDGR